MIFKGGSNISNSNTNINNTDDDANERLIVTI